MPHGSTYGSETGAGSYGDVALLEPTDDEGIPAGLRDEVGGACAEVVTHAAAGDNPTEAVDAFHRLQVLRALRRGPDGAEAWNERIEEWLSETQVQRDGPWYPGRPVMVRENEYSTGLFNGDLGVTVTVDGQRRIAFEHPDGELRLMSPARLPAHETAWP